MNILRPYASQLMEVRSCDDHGGVCVTPKWDWQNLLCNYLTNVMSMEDLSRIVQIMEDTTNVNNQNIRKWIQAKCKPTTTDSDVVPAAQRQGNDNVIQTMCNNTKLFAIVILRTSCVIIAFCEVFLHHITSKNKKAKSSKDNKKLFFF
ncbi:hypothetical protein RFI_21989 [Reticulomyxa filosa]|uniref:Uncharacterized protein n=1 Tax=Reticulomyxa filosa TaxID=46433 RepID=X6MP20_RETFI|nr:hypothetical protein RFI_21989 [Reticulomyxa filosa]|eukprot:ETO15376.1 hypothetical protein RFI_21989 [Reticulomyxa filosa]